MIGGFALTVAAIAGIVYLFNRSKTALTANTKLVFTPNWDDDEVKYHLSDVGYISGTIPKNGSGIGNEERSGDWGAVTISHWKAKNKFTIILNSKDGNTIDSKEIDFDKKTIK